MYDAKLAPWANEIPDGLRISPDSAFRKKWLTNAFRRTIIHMLIVLVY